MLGLAQYFSIFFLRRPLEMNEFFGSSAPMYRFLQLADIDNRLLSKAFEVSIIKPDEYGFFKQWYLVSDDSKHHDLARHVVLVTSLGPDLEPTFRHLSSGPSGGTNAMAKAKANLRAVVAVFSEQKGDSSASFRS